MLVEQVDIVRAQALEHGIHHGADVLRPAGEATLLPKCEAELGSDDEALTVGGQHPAQEALVVEGAVGLGGVEEGNAPLDGGQQRALGLGLIHRAIYPRRKAHTAQAKRGNNEALAAEGGGFHWVKLRKVFAIIKTYSKAMRGVSWWKCPC